MRIRWSKAPSAPASSAFSISSFAAAAGRSTTSPAAIRFTAAGGSYVPEAGVTSASAAPHDPAAYPHDVLADDQMALIAHLGLTDFDLGGYSLGARTTARMLAALAAKVMRLHWLMLVRNAYSTILKS